MLSGRYRLVRFIARGGMAEVWEGHDQILSRAVAVKVLQRQYATDEVFLERFRREAVAAARLAHPGVVATYDAGVDGPTTYIVMELVRGDTLRRFLAERGPLPPALAVDLAAQITDALVHAHRAGIVHRDIKPANILLRADEEGAPRVKVTDFGIAKAAAGLGLDLTTTGLVLGTPRYLSPEQIRGEEPDARADLYGLGVVLFEALTGRSPFGGETEMAMALARLNQPAPRLRQVRPDLSPGLDAIVAGLLAADRSQRIPSATVLRDELAKLRAGPNSATVAIAGTVAGTVPGTVAGAYGPAVWTGAPTGTTIADRERPPAGRVPPGQGPPPRRPPLPSGPPVSRGQRRRRHPHRIPGLIVGAVAVAGVIVAALLVGNGHSRTPGGSGGGTSAIVPIATVQVWIIPPQHKPDNVTEVSKTHDGNPSTVWSTVRYTTPNFGGYGGEGLAIQVQGTHVLHELTVTSPTHGWAASTYVGDQEGANNLASWGSQIDSKSDIQGNTTFSLGDRRGSWVLLWLTNTGPSLVASVAELQVR